MLLVSFFGYGQTQTRVIQGRITSLNNDVSNILVVNLNSKQSTITDSLGVFAIEARLRDTLRITALQYQSREISITEKNFEEGILVLFLFENVIDLDEVTVTPYNLSGKIDLDLQQLALVPDVSASALALPNADSKTLTQGQRLLIEADRGKYVSYYGIGLTINTHKIMNALSGRTKTLKERVARDEKLKLEKEIIAKFSKKSMASGFDIPESELNGFLTYCMSQSDFSAMEQANTKAMWDYLKEKSYEFKETGILKEKGE